MKEIVIIVIGVFGCMSILLVGLFAFDMYIRCPNFGNAVERPYKFALFGGGCFVQDIDGRWVQEKNYWNSPQTTDYPTP